MFKNINIKNIRKKRNLTKKLIIALVVLSLAVAIFIVVFVLANNSNSENKSKYDVESNYGSSAQSIPSDEGAKSDSTNQGTPSVDDSSDFSPIKPKKDIPATPIPDINPEISIETPQ